MTAYHSHAPHVTQYALKPQHYQRSPATLVATRFQVPLLLPLPPFHVLGIERTHDWVFYLHPCSFPRRRVAELSPCLARIVPAHTVGSTRRHCASSYLVHTHHL